MHCNALHRIALRTDRSSYPHVGISDPTSPTLSTLLAPLALLALLWHLRHFRHGISVRCATSTYHHIPISFMSLRLRVHAAGGGDRVGGATGDGDGVGDGVMHAPHCIALRTDRSMYPHFGLSDSTFPNIPDTSGTSRTSGIAYPSDCYPENSKCVYLTANVTKPEN